MNGQLRRIRQIKALSRKELADKSAVHEITIYRAERGETKLRPSTARKLANALEIDVSDLTSEQGLLGI